MEVSNSSFLSDRWEEGNRAWEAEVDGVTGGGRVRFAADREDGSEWEEGNRAWEAEVDGVTGGGRVRFAADREDGSEREEEEALLRELAADSSTEPNEEEEDEEDATPLAVVGNVPINIRAISNTELLKVTPEDLAMEFEERIAQVGWELDEARDAQIEIERNWNAKYKELMVKYELQDTELSTSRGHVQELTEKISNYKKNLWMQAVDIDTIKMVEDEVKEAVAEREKDLLNLRIVKNEEIRLIRQHHQRDLDEVSQALITRLEESHSFLKQKRALLPDMDDASDDENPYNSIKTDVNHTTLGDPIQILNLLKKVTGKPVHDIVYGAEKNAGIDTPLAEYKERELKLVNDHIGKTPAEVSDEKKKDLAERFENARKLRADVLENLTGDLANQFTEYHKTETEREHRAVENFAIIDVLEDPIFSVLLESSRFGEKFENVIRENELLKSRLHVIGGTKSSGLGLKELEDRKLELKDMVEKLETTAEKLNRQCVKLEEQKTDLKGIRKEIADEIQSMSETIGGGMTEELGRVVGSESDSDDTTSINEEDSFENDHFNPEHEPVLDQIAGVEFLVEEPEEETKTQHELEQKQFAATMRKEAHVSSLVEQILQYLECGATIYRVQSGQISKDFAYLTGNRSVINICQIQEGKPNRKATIELIMLKDIKSILMGQYTEGYKRFVKEYKENKIIDPNELHKVPKENGDGIEVYNTGMYFYRSISLRMRKGKTFNFIANTDNDFETWTVGLHRITTLVPRYEKGLETIPFMRGYEVLNPDEKAFCETSHTPPLLYLNAKMQCMKQEYKHYLTLYDVRTLSGFDLLHSQKVFELWLLMSWLEKRFVYQIKYLEIFPEEASNLVAEIDAARQKERKQETDRLLHA
eukprot:TRINITY_DN16331_c3_g1_i1.p1 TRINITY_DN16331_c3_g1~~TRINITY_DN16331_c3_g1_i1.p1  ORF type:complete len:876 (+),score=192.90 TRINITY_DN16331_c3_g1_i1:37-2664(+)